MLWLAGSAKLLLLVQAASPSVLGTVVDGAGGTALSGAVVTLPGLGRTSVSDTGGRYSFASLPPGPQRITVIHLGYASRTLNAIVPSAGALEINFALHAEPFVLPSIDVWSPGLALGERGDSAPFPERGISMAAMSLDPKLSEPDPFLALGGGAVAMSPEAPGGVHIRGGASDHTGYLLDGVPILSPYHAAGVFSAWNPDAIERVDLLSASPSPALPDALAGTVAGVTRAPGSRVRAQGSVSTMQARATADGPLGIGRAGFLLSFRSGLPGLLAPRRESSYLGGHAADVLATLQAPALGGRVRLFGYDNANVIGAASIVGGIDASGPEPARNAFTWHSRSLGVEWTRRTTGGLMVRVRGWSATGEAGARWSVEREPSVDLASLRRDEGAVVDVERSSGGATTEAGVRIQRSRTSYRVAREGEATPSLALSVSTPVTTAFFRHSQRLPRGLTAEVALSAGAASGEMRLAPSAQLLWSVSHSLTISGGYARMHQFSQSLRNPESVVGTVFPADLWVGSGSGGVPVAHSDQGVLAAEYHPGTGIRLSGQAYLRRSGGLVVVAPQTGEPFATGRAASGSGLTRGASVDASVSGAWYGLVASYGWERVRFTQGGVRYVPAYGAEHRLEAGVIVFPSATLSIRLGATGAFGRRITAVASTFEWESCNLLDRGCELAGSPRYRTDELGATRLPSYLRLDFGLRKEWDVRVAGTTATVALFGTITNLLDRKNVLTTTVNPSIDQPVPVELRPRAPLVVGLDWRF